METMHTEKTLKGLTKAQLLEIAAANEIEANETMKNDDIKTLILEKGCPVKEQEQEQKQEQETENTSVPKFTKEQILASKWFSHRRDILTVLLSDEKQYAHGEVDKMLVEFMKGKVN